MTAKLIDTHAHLTSDELLGEIDQVLSRAEQNGISAIVSVGTDPEDCRRVRELSARYRPVFAAYGIHPHLADRYSDPGQLRATLGGDKMVAIGETGLDYHYEFADRTNQRRLFEQHLALADELDLPVIVHCRDAFDDALVIIRSAASLRGVFHCFTGNAETAERIIALGWYVSFTGIVTFNKSIEVARAAADVPLERILIETDAPYISPEPVRRQKPNEPANVKYIAEKLSEIRQIDLQKLLEQLWDNAVRLFGTTIEGASE